MLAENQHEPAKRARALNLTALSVLSGAVGVGIGFGLQKVVSNFISGNVYSSLAGRADG